VSAQRDVYVGLGSNLGDREQAIRLAVRQLAEIPDTLVQRVSCLYDTEPVGETAQPRFLNAVAELETPLDPRTLLWHLMLIETRLGRVRTRRWGPRTIDLDLLLYADRIIEEEGLSVPHPEMLRRGFVLVPIVELAPRFLHPVTQRPLVDHLRDLQSATGVTRKGTLWS
jgi:2-amino-4-hydroxy-6-hydroxymethyldihydropteridine diphosphokinase